MNTQSVIQVLEAERQRLDVAIEVLRGRPQRGRPTRLFTSLTPVLNGPKRRGRPPGSKNRFVPVAEVEGNGKGRWSLAARKRASLAQKRRWRDVKKAAQAKA